MGGSYYRKKSLFARGMSSIFLWLTCFPMKINYNIAARLCSEKAVGTLLPCIPYPSIGSRTHDGLSACDYVTHCNSPLISCVVYHGCRGTALRVVWHVRICEVFQNKRGYGKKRKGRNIGFEAKLWLAADKLRNNMDAAEYKHVVLGLIFLKYISDSFEQHRAKLVAGEGEYAGANPEDQDEYKAENVFWVPKEARWTHLQANAKQPTIGKLVDDAMVAIERDNSRLKGVLPKDYALGRHWINTGWVS